ncbi:MAG: DnaJ C-terminal domain-containing protein, partial [Planctomycetota bacterium]
PQKRKRYGRFGENWEHGQEFRPGSGDRTMSREDFEQAFGGGGGFSDFFQEMFGEQYAQDFGERFRGSRRRPGPQRGADVRTELRLPLTSVVHGGKQSFTIPVRVTCPTCGGEGSLQRQICPSCMGIGSTTNRRKVDLSLPEAPRDGMTLRLRGLGEEGDEGATSGDLHLTLRLEEDDDYSLVGGVLEAKLRVAPWDAHFGVKADVRTARGEVTLTIPPGTRTGKRMRLRGQGFAASGGGTGDCTVRLLIDLPETLSERQVELLDALRQETADEPTA